MKQRIAYIIGTTTLLSAFAIGIVTAAGDRGGYGERGGHEEHEEHERGERGGESPGRFPGMAAWRDVAPVTDQGYLAECGSCHFPYQPGLLPAASWEAVLNGLADHFGDNAELPPATLEPLRAYLLENAADRRPIGRSPAFARVGDRIPLRISETPYFRGKHDEIPPRMVLENPQIGSWSRCDACHVNAAQGSYNEHEIRIPGVGRWDD